MEPNVSRYINFMLLLSPSYVSSLYSLDHIWSLFLIPGLLSPVLLVARILLRIHFISKLYTFESVMRKITLINCQAQAQVLLKLTQAQ